MSATIAAVVIGSSEAGCPAGFPHASQYSDWPVAGVEPPVGERLDGGTRHRQRAA
jgi:hypothetical protein